MFDRTRQFLGGLFDRVTRDPRNPGAGRVGSSMRTTAGVIITPDTAVTVPAVWACLRYLSQTTAMLPWRVMKETDGGGELAPRHPVDRLLYVRASREWSPFQFRETLLHWALRWGNGYAEIERDTTGRPIGLWPIHPERVEVCRDPETNELYYEVNNGTGEKAEIAVADMFHIRGFGEGPVGVNVIHYAAQSIGWARAAQIASAAFFGSGMNVNGVVTLKRSMNDMGLRRFKAELDDLYKGPGKYGKVAIIDGAEADWKAVGINAREAQLVELHQHLVEDVARWFGVPPHKIMHLLRSTNNNIEHQSIEVVQDSILPWVKRFEEEADYKLFGANRMGFYTKINLMGLLRGDFKSQAEGFRVYREMGVVNANEIRERIDLNPMPGDAGKKFTMQGQYTTLEKIGQDPEPAPAPDPEADATQATQAMDRVERLLEIA